MLRELDALGYEGDYALEFELGGDPEAMAELALKPGTQVSKCPRSRMV